MGRLGYPGPIQDSKCSNGVLTNLEANRFKDAQAVYEDLNLIFLNALHYDMEDNQIAKDTNTLKVRFETGLATTQPNEWCGLGNPQSGPNDLRCPLPVVKRWRTNEERPPKSILMVEFPSLSRRTRLLGWRRVMRS